MNSSHYPISSDHAIAAYIVHEQTMILPSNVADTHRMVTQSIAGRRQNIQSVVFSGDLMTCPNCGRETGGSKYCGKCR